MSYKVLARKWRPDHFDEVVGQGHVARTLINSIEQDRVAHAYLFCGARGVGKTSTARILAKAMNCEEGPTPRPCYKCSSCLEISKGQSVDVFEIDGASNRGINEIRELREGVRYAPSRDEKKIYIIDEVHMLTTEAFNALLKTLEEPPSHAIFIFATTEPQKIPVTILSRCQRFDFKRISQQDIVEHLEKLCDHEDINAEKAALQVIARQANGGMRDALSLLDQIISFSGKQITEAEITEILGVANRKHLFELSEAALAGDAEQALLVLDDVNRYGYDLQQFASELVTHFRDLMVTSVVAEPEKVTQLTESELAMARRQLEGLPSELLHRYFSVMVDGAQNMNRSAYPKLVFEMTLVRLCELEPMENLDVLVERLALLESSMEGDGGPVEWPSFAGRPGRDSSAAEDSRDRGRQQKPEPTTAAATREPAPSATEDDDGDDSDDDSDQGQQIGLVSSESSESVESAAEESPDIEEERAEEEEQEEEEQEEDDQDGPGADDHPPVDIYEDSSSSDVAEEPEPDPEPEPEADEPVEPEPEEPQIPQPLRPKEELELPDVENLESPADKWRAVVEVIRQNNAPAAATCEHALVEQFDEGKVRLCFEPGYFDLAGEEARRKIIEGAIEMLFGEGWTTVIREQEGAAPAETGKTMAQEREEDIERRRDELAVQLRENPTVKAAREIFEADEPKISVRLYDE